MTPAFQNAPYWEYLRVAKERERLTNELIETASNLEKEDRCRINALEYQQEIDNHSHQNAP